MQEGENELEGVSHWALGVCICSVTACIVEILVSDTRLEKNVRLVLGAFMLCAVIFPLGSLFSDMTLPDVSGDICSDTSLSDNLSGQREEYINSALEELVIKKLSEKGITPKGIEVKTDIDDEMSISIITAEITLDKKDSKRAAEVSRFIKNETGIECRTIIA